MQTTSYCKSRFHLPEGTHYFCGHSLGPQSIEAKNALIEGALEWENHLVSAWTQAQWIDLPKACGDKIAPLIGAHTDEVIVCDNTTLNIMKLLLLAISQQCHRKVILTEIDNFPTDLYIAQSVAALHGMTLKVVARNQILTSLDESVAVLLLTHVNYRTAQKWEMKIVNQKAKCHGIKTVWDLSHSVGVMKLACSELETDFAVGCTYKYLNGGPGAPSFLYVNRQHQHLHPSLQAWMGHVSPFSFSGEYQPARGIKRHLSGTPAILSMKALLGALSIYEMQDLDLLEKESQQLTHYFIEQSARIIPELQCVSPLAMHQRGSHVAFTHPQGEALSRALIEQGVIVDYREPNLIRFGISPLYINRKNIDEAIMHLKAQCQLALSLL